MLDKEPQEQLTATIADTDDVICAADEVRDALRSHCDAWFGRCDSLHVNAPDTLSIVNDTLTSEAPFLADLWCDGRMLLVCSPTHAPMQH
jgi:hypothetical protein